VEANVGNPQVAYKETIRKSVKSEGKYIRQSGGKGQYGHCWIEIEPKERGTGYEFVNKIVGGVIPKEYIPAVDAGIQSAMNNGVLAGYVSMAFKEGMKKADPVILEPIMKVVVTVPEDYMGDVIGDLNSRRGRIEGMEARAGAQVIHAYVPLAEMFGYATALRSRSQGRGVFSMEISHFEEVPKKIISGRAKNNSSDE